MNPSREAVRKATYDDVPRLTSSLVRAFEDDPAINWILRQDRKRSEAFNTWFRLCLRKVSLPHDEVYTTDDCSGAALWRPPGVLDIGFIDRLLLLPDIIRVTGIRGFKRFSAFMTAVEEVHPRASHYYLQMLGVDPDHQGEGIGSALLEPVLHTCDRVRCGAYLETSKERNLGFYRRHGFALRGEIVPQPGGPRVWTMWRRPR